MTKHDSDRLPTFSTVMQNIMMADPLSARGMSALNALGLYITENEYLNKVYIPPFSLYEHDQNEKIDNDADPDHIDYMDEKEQNRERGKRDDFESNLKLLSDSMFLINGEAGSGKTTYIHKLANQFKDSHAFHICDFEQSQDSIYFMDEPFDFGQLYKSNVWKYVSIVLEYIGNILERKDMSIKDHKEYITYFVKEYKNAFATHTEGMKRVDNKQIREFFSILENYGKNGVAYEEFSEQLRAMFKSAFKDFEEKDEKEEAVTYITGILIRMCFCLFRKQGKKQVCAIDNVEFCVPFDEAHPIQDCEIDYVFNGVNDAVTKVRSRLDRISKANKEYETFYGVVFVTRPTSISFVDCCHHIELTSENIINISKWFCIEDICRRKMEFFGDALKKFEGSPIMNAFLNVMGDCSNYNWGLQDLVSRMYNYNKRRIVENLTIVLSSIPERSLKYFNEQWEKTQNAGDDEFSQDTAPKAYLKHLCRKFIFRNILDYIRETRYFDKLLVERRGASARREHPLENLKSSYARITATVLYRNSIEQGSRTTGRGKITDAKTVSFPELVEAVLCRANLGKHVSEHQIQDLASILYLMNETRNERTNWAPLIRITFDIQTAYNETNLYKEILSEWESYVQNGEIDEQITRSYNVTITEAGELFAKMVPDFEYFACRYAPCYPALLDLQNLRKTVTENAEEYDCISLIKTVQENAFVCVDEVIARERYFFASTQHQEKEAVSIRPLFDPRSRYKWFYTQKSGGALLPHAVRILNHQHGYLLHYQRYIENLPDNVFSDSNDRMKILDSLRKVIQLYTDKMKEVSAIYQC